MAFLAQHIKGDLQVLGTNGTAPVTFNVPLDTGVGVALILEELLMKMQRLSTEKSWRYPSRGMLGFAPGLTGSGLRNTKPSRYS